jgi:hypothetical protein
MKKNTVFIWGMLAVLLTFGIGLAACGGKSYEDLQRQAFEAVSEGDMEKAWKFQEDMGKYVERAEVYDVLKKVIWGIVIVVIIAAIGLGVYWTYLKNNNPDKLPPFMKKLWGINMKQGEMAGKPVSTEAPVPETTKLTDNATSMGGAWQIFMLIFVCGNALAGIIGLNEIAQQPALLIDLVLSRNIPAYILPSPTIVKIFMAIKLIGDACCVLVFLTLKKKILSVKIPCTIAAVFSTLIQLYYVLIIFRIVVFH